MLYDDSLPVAARPDVTYYPMPVGKLVKEASLPFELRDYIANMVYVGVLVHILDLDMAESRPRRVELRRQAQAHRAQHGHGAPRYDWAQANLVKTDPYRAERMTGFNEDKMLVDGNTALRRHLRRVTVVSWYPITPHPACPTLSKYLPKLRTDLETGRALRHHPGGGRAGVFCMVIAAGRRAMTATSGPGIDLMAEFAGLAYFAEVPRSSGTSSASAPAPACRHAPARATSPQPTISAMATRATRCSSRPTRRKRSSSATSRWTWRNACKPWLWC